MLLYSIVGLSKSPVSQISMNPELDCFEAA
jgi:hypothetical protein